MWITKIVFFYSSKMSWSLCVCVEVGWLSAGLELQTLFLCSAVGSGWSLHSTLWDLVVFLECALHTCSSEINQTFRPFMYHIWNSCSLDTFFLKYIPTPSCFCGLSSGSSISKTASFYQSLAIPHEAKLKPRSLKNIGNSPRCHSLLPSVYIHFRFWFGSFVSVFG